MGSFYSKTEGSASMMEMDKGNTSITNCSNDQPSVKIYRVTGFESTSKMKAVLYKSTVLVKGEKVQLPNDEDILDDDRIKRLQGDRFDVIVRASTGEVRDYYQIVSKGDKFWGYHVPSMVSLNPSEIPPYAQKSEEVDYVSVTYEIKEAEVLSSTPEVIAKQLLENDSNTEQSQIFKFSESRMITSSFSHTHGFEVKKGSEFKAGIPLIASEKVTVEVSTQHSWTLGETDAKERRFEYEFPIKAEAHSKVMASAIAHKKKVSIPFVGTVHFKGSDRTEKIYGNWVGVDFVDIKSQFENVN